MSLQGIFGLIDYLLYLVQTTNRHGVHSPFVYHFTDRVLYGNLACQFEPSAELCRKRLIQSKRKIKFNDREILLSKFALELIPSSKYNRLIFRWIQDQQLGNYIIEIGSSMGVMPLYFQRGSAEVNRYFVFDKVDTLLTISEYNIREYDCGESVSFSSYQKADDIIKKLGNLPTNSIDLLIINEALESVEFWKLVDWATPKLGDRGCIVMTTLRHSQEQGLLWQQLKNQPKITVGIDLFAMGMAFARNTQKKENFLLRY